MNKWQEAYSKLKKTESNLKNGIITEWTLVIIVSVLLMLVEDKLHE